MRDAISLRYNLNSDNHQFDTVVVAHRWCVDHLSVNLETNKWKNRDNVENESDYIRVRNSLKNMAGNNNKNTVDCILGGVITRERNRQIFVFIVEFFY